MWIRMKLNIKHFREIFNGTFHNEVVDAWLFEDLDKVKEISCVPKELQRDVVAWRPGRATTNCLPGDAAAENPTL
jgi:hypothetical protein